MRFLKTLLCLLLAAALLLAMPCTVLAEEGGDIPVLSETLEDAADAPASEKESGVSPAQTERIEAEPAGAEPEEGEPEAAPKAEADLEEMGEDADLSGQEAPEAPADGAVPAPPGENAPSLQALPEGTEAWQVLENGVILAPAEDVSIYPVIRYSGAMNSLYHSPDPNLPQEEWEVAFSHDSYRDINNLWPVVKDAFFAFCRFDYKGVSQIISDFIWSAFKYARMDEEGEDSYYPGVAINPWSLYGWQDEDGYYQFATDWREDPVKSAHKLRTYIEDLCVRLGCEKVNLIGVSGNGNTVLAYLHEYMDDLKLGSVFFNYSLHAGSSTYGDFATMNVGISPQAAGKMSPNKMEDIFVSPDPYEILLRGAYEIGIFDYLAKLFKFNFDRVKQDIYDNAAIPLLFTNPRVWSYVPLDQYEQAKTLLLKSDPKYDKLVEKLDYYHYEVMQNQKEILREAAGKIKVAVRTGYNRPLYAYTTGANVHSDDKVDTEYASFGATCAPLNETFSIFYTQKVPSKYDYISPDRMIDVSTCAIPELTWLGRNQPHLADGTRDYNGWYGWFLSATGDYTVHGNPEYPQFTEYIGGAVYVPLVVERNQAGEIAATIGLWALKAWRWALMAPFFWV